MFEVLGSRTFRYRHLIVAAWLVTAFLAVRFAPSLASQGAADQASFLPSFAPSAQANAALDQAFPGATSVSSATLTFSRDVPLSEGDQAYLDATAAWVTSAEAPSIVRDAVTGTESATSRPELASMLESSDGQVELLVLNLNVGSVGDQADAIVSALRDHVRATAPAGLAVHVTGAAGISSDYLQAVKAGTDSTTVVTIALVVVILLLIYRAPLAALVPLITIGAAYVVSRAVLGLLAAAGWKVSSLLDTFLVVLVFGVGTDYTIFLISRFREETRGRTGWHDASRTTVRRIGAVITASAATVIVGLGAMAFGDFEMIRTTGPLLGVAIAVTLIAGLTLTPALLGIFGHYLFWPLHDQPKLEGEPTGLFSRLAAAVSRHPAAVVVVLLVALLLPVGFIPQLRTNFDVLAELPASSDARAGFQVVSDHLGRGKLVQTTALVDTGSADMLAPAELARLHNAVGALQATAGVSSVTSLVTPNGDGVVPDGMVPSVQLGTIADAFGESGSSGSASTGASSSLLDPELSTGLADAFDYVGALGAAFPDVAGRSEYRAARQAITDAQDVVDRVRTQSVVATQLRTLAAALTSPTSLGAGGGSDSGILADYLDELAAAHPEVTSLHAFDRATVAADAIRRKPTAGAAIAAAAALDSLARHFDALPDATLAPKSLAHTPSALEAKREAKAIFAALPPAFDGLAAVFAGRSDDLFVPLGLGDDEARQDVSDAVDAFMSADRTATRFYLTLADDPYATSAFATTRTIVSVLAAAAPAFGSDAHTYVTGATAQLSDVQDVLAADFNHVGVVTVLGILLVLVLLLRALVAPVYLVATVLVSYGSALGLSAWLFQGPLGQPGVSFYLPLMVFVLLVALGSDYNIFLMSRVREESETRPIRDGIRIASGHTGAVITSAGLILAGTFGSMATAPLIVLFQVGVAVALGVLIDTFIVRSILVPAITTLVGNRAWWPSGIRVTTAGRPAMALAPGLILVEPERRSTTRVAVAIALAILLPAAFAGLISWAQQPSAGALRAAVVNADEGATVTASDGSTQHLRLGAGLTDQLLATPASDAIDWDSTDAASAAEGLAAERYAAVLTIPAGFSSAIAAIRADASGMQPAAALHLETGAPIGVTAVEVAQEVRAAVLLSAASDATASYVADMLLGVSTTYADMDAAATDARSIADRMTLLASDTSGARTIAGELVSGLDALADGTATAVDGARRLAGATSDLAAGTRKLARSTTLVAGGASSLADNAELLGSLVHGYTGSVASLSANCVAMGGGPAVCDALTSLTTSYAGLDPLAAGVSGGAADLAAGTSQLAAGADELKTGAVALSRGTAGLAGSAGKLTDGVEQAAEGARLVQAGVGQLAMRGHLLADDASAAADRLESAAAWGIAYPLDTRARIAARVARPVTLVTSGAAPGGTGLLGPAGTAAAPLATALALWLGALGATVLLVSGRRRRGVPGALAEFARAAATALLGAGLMVLVLGLGLGLEIARLPEFGAIVALAAVAFVAVMQALVVLFGMRGWLLALLLAAVQAAVAGYPVGVESLPAALAFLHPLLPVSWAFEALRACIAGSGSIAMAVVMLSVWLAGALLVTLAATVAGGRHPLPAPTAA